MSAPDALQAIYDAIPAVQGCRTSCRDCCGPVPVSPAEAARIGPPVNFQPSPWGPLTPTLPGCHTCALSSPAGCTIYARRPIMCRLFGAVDTPRLTCPHGARAARLLSEGEARDLIDRVRALQLKGVQPDV